jgi:hypothetical protein
MDNLLAKRRRAAYQGAAVDGGVLVVSSRQAAPVCEAVEGTFDDVAAA